MKMERSVANHFAGFAEDLAAAQMAMDGKIEGDARTMAEEGLRLFEERTGRTGRISVLLGRITATVSVEEGVEVTLVAERYGN